MSLDDFFCTLTQPMTLASLGPYRFSNVEIAKENDQVFLRKY